MDVKIISVVIGALLGGALSSVGFYFRSRQEVKEKINTSLFQLLEIWSLIAMIRVTGSDKFNSMLIARIKKQFPHEKIGQNEEKLLKEGMIESLPFLAGIEENNLNGEYLDKYRSSVNDLAKIYPLLAFELNQNQMLIQFLGSVDKLFSDNHTDDHEQLFLKNMREFMLGESFKDLELDLIKLSSLSGFSNKRLTKKRIERQRKRFEAIPSDVFDEYIKRVIAPAVQAHYDSLGVANPNVNRSKSPNNSTHATNV